MAPAVLIVFSHRRWALAFQRPQQLMSRLAGRWRVLFIEEPQPTAGAAHLQVREVAAGLAVLVPRTPIDAPGFVDGQRALVQPLLAGYLQAQSLHVDMAWLYTPLALPLAAALGARCMVYDCVDGLHALKGAPCELRQRETALLQQAALVLTAGPSLYEARRGQHPHVLCFPSAVDAAHFWPGRLQEGSAHDLAAQALQAATPRPRLGYFGAIDQRMNLPLVALVADSRPEWSLIMAGPVVDIDPASLPQRPNIHWLGLQPYDRLPYLLAGWDLCLMPFVINGCTRFINPTKTLEYMAGDKAVVSTPVRDVISLYGDVVAVAPGPQGFVQACESLLAERGQARCARAIGMLCTVSMYSWDSSADCVHALMLQALERSPRRAVPQPSPATLDDTMPLAVPAALLQAAQRRDLHSQPGAWH